MWITQKWDLSTFSTCEGLYDYEQAESELVEEVISVIEDAVRESIPLWYRLWMELDDFKVDEEDIVAVSGSNTPFWTFKCSAVI